MSLVTNVLLLCGLREREKMAELSLDFTDIGQFFGGPKRAEAGVWGCAANYLDEERFLSRVKATQWEQPEYVQVFVQRQEEMTFTQIWPPQPSRLAEMTFAFERASGAIESSCVVVETAEGFQYGWYDLDSVDTTGIDIEDEISYLDARRLLLHHPENPRWVTLLDEGEPLEL
jgi:hypothetical protein